jgi:hypothetical protein
MPTLKYERGERERPKGAGTNRDHALGTIARRVVERALDEQLNAEPLLGSRARTLQRSRRESGGAKGRQAGADTLKPASDGRWHHRSHLEQRGDRQTPRLSDLQRSD